MTIFCNFERINSTQKLTKFHMSVESSQGIEIPEQKIVIPSSVVENIEERTELTRQQIAEKLPINLGRGVPPFTNEALIDMVDEMYLIEQERDNAGFHTYTGRKHEKVSEPNAFRGDRGYIDLAVRILKNEFGLNIQPSQLLTGTSGGQDLVTEILDYHQLDEQRRMATTNRTFDRTKRHLIRRMESRMEIGALAIISANKSGETVLGNAKRHFSGQRPGALFLVDPGSNPDGETMDREELKEIIDIAHKRGGKVVLDGAYARLHHHEEDQLDLSELQEYFDEGTLSMILTATKEGGRRGPAFAVGSEELMKKLMKLRSDRLLSPNYDLQIKHAIMENITVEDLKELELSHLSSFGKFMDSKIRPHLALNFAIVKSILSTVGMKLSNMNVTHGYNVSVLLPDETSGKNAEFFAKLRTLGVNSPDLSSFSNRNNEDGFRIPFGGFSSKECEIFCTLIAQAYKEIYG